MESARHDDAQVARIRDGLVDTLLSTGVITTPIVERAFRAVPRHRFVADGTALEVAYGVDEAVALKRHTDGTVLSSTSAAYIQARMLEQAELGPGMSVLEIGSGGCNAALLAEVVGPGGRVISVDIDAEVTRRAHDVLAATGYGDRVTVVCADAEAAIDGLPEQVDAILVTVGAWDLAPAWLTRLSPAGRIAVPLRMNQVTRAIGFRREHDHLVSTSAAVCGFVPMQGLGAHDEHAVALSDQRGHHVTLRFDGDPPAELPALDAALTRGRAEAWAGVTVENGVSFADLHLWFAAFLPGFCRLAADEGTDLAAERKHWRPFAVVRGDSFAYLAVRPLPGGGAELGAGAYGRHGEGAAAAMVEQIQAWDRQARGAPAPTFAYWPTGAALPRFDGNTAVLPKAHGLVTISWPPAAGDRS